MFQKEFIPFLIKSKKWILCFGIIFLFTCSQKNLKHPYFPLKKGKTWVYKILLDGKSSNYQLQELISDASKENTFFILSYLDSSYPKHHHPDEPIIYSLDKQGVMCDECRTYVLPFFTKKNEMWGTKNQKYKILSINQTVSIGSFTFQNCLIVLKTDQYLNQKIEITYAPNVGKIKSRFFKLSQKITDQPFREEHLLEYGEIHPGRYLH